MEKQLEKVLEFEGQEIKVITDKGVELFNLSNSAKVECAYNTTKYNFNKALKEHNINREQVLSIKKYLLRHTDKIDQDKQFKNDIHCIYSLMKSHNLKVRDFQIINCIIGGN